MPYNLIFNAAATDPKSALCKSVTNLTPTSPPAWVAGESRALQIYIADGAGDFDPISGDATADVRLGLGLLGATPSGGTFTMDSDGDVTSALAYNISAGALQTALNALGNVTTEGGLVVSGTFPNFALDWNTVGAKELIVGDGSLLSPDSEASVVRVRTGDGSTKERQMLMLRRQPVALQTSFSTITDGWAASFNLNTRGVVDLVGTSAAVTDAYLELRVTDADGNVRVYGQVGNIIRNNVIDPLSLVPVPLPDYLTASATRAQFVQNRSSITGLVGGTAYDLDGILTANAAQAAGTLVALVLDDTLSIYQLQAGGQATSSPDVIRPADFNATTNAQVWVLISSGSGGGGGGELRFWEESTDVIGSTQASVWTPNAEGIDPVPDPAMPDVNTTDVVEFGTYPAGTYRVTYSAGAMRYGPGLTQWKLNASVSYGFRVVHSGGTEIEGPGNSYTGYNTIAEVEAANAGAYVEFTHTGGTIGVRLEDTPIDDNTPGTPSPTFLLTGANVDLHAVLQPIGDGSVILCDATSAPPTPTADSQMVQRFSGGYLFNGGNATFEGTAAGDDPVDAQDFVTKAYGDANYSGGGAFTPDEIGGDGIVDGALSTSFYRTLTDTTDFSFVNFDDGASFQIEVTQPSPAETITWPAEVAWVDDTAEPTVDAGKTIIFSFWKRGSTYHGTAALGISDESAVVPTQLVSAGEQIAARDLVFQDATDEQGGGIDKWWKVDTDTSPPRIGARIGMAVTADDGTGSGGSWTARESQRDWCGVACSYDGTFILASDKSPGYLYTSDDSGVTWTQRADSRAWRGVAASSDGSKLVAVVGSGYIYTSDDSGVTWTQRADSRVWRAVCSSADGVKLAATVSSGYIYTSADSGVTWTQRATSENWTSIASSSDGSKLVACINGGYIYTSDDSGVTWTQRDSSISAWSAASSSDGTRLAVGGSSGVRISSDSGVTWELLGQSFGGGVFALASSGSGAVLLAGVQGGKLWISNNYGVSWVEYESNRYWNGAAASENGAKLVAVAINSGSGDQYIYTFENIYTPGTFTCRLEPGSVSGFSGLTPGAAQYASATAGALTETVPTGLRRLVGHAIDATTLYFEPRLTDAPQNATPSAAKFLDETGQFSVPAGTAPEIRAGRVTVGVLDTSFVVTFSTPMADADYAISLLGSGISVAFTISDQTDEGFTVGFTAGISGTVNWIAVHDN
jgi:hypothetical protein